MDGPDIHAMPSMPPPPRNKALLKVYRGPILQVVNSNSVVKTCYFAHATVLPNGCVLQHFFALPPKTPSAQQVSTLHTSLQNSCAIFKQTGEFPSFSIPTR